MNECCWVCGEPATKMFQRKFYCDKCTEVQNVYKSEDICPECSSKLIHTGGCVECSSRCGYARCG